MAADRTDRAGLAWLRSLTSPDQDTRQQGEAYLQSLRKDPSALLSTILEGVAQCDQAFASKFPQLSQAHLPANSAFPADVTDAVLSDVFSTHQLAFILLRTELKDSSSYDDDGDGDELSDFYWGIGEEGQSYLKDYLLQYLSRRLPYTCLPALKACACVVGEVSRESASELCKRRDVDAAVMICATLGRFALTPRLSRVHSSNAAVKHSSLTARFARRSSQLAGMLFELSPDLPSSISEWPSLFPTLSTLASHSSPVESRSASTCAFANGIVENLTCHFTLHQEASPEEQLQRSLTEGFLSTMTAGLRDRSLSARADAMKATMLLLEYLHVEEILTPFESLPKLMTTAFAEAVGQALSGSGPHPPDILAFAIDSAEILIELSSCVHVSIMRPCLPELARLALTFAGHMPLQADDAEKVNAVRRLCLELAITIAEVNPPLCRRMAFDVPGLQRQSFSQMLVGSCFKFLKEREDEETDEEYVASEVSETDPDHIDHTKVGAQSLQRTFETLGVSAAWVIATGHVNELLKSQDPEDHLAAMHALCVMAIFMHDSDGADTESPVRQVNKAVVPFLSPSQPPRTVHAAISFIAVVSSNAAFTQEEQRRIVPILLGHTTKQSQPCARIRVHALAAIGQFIETQLKPEGLCELADAALGRFTTACVEGPLMVIEAAITAIGSVAHCAPPKFFDKYYGAIMPVLKNLLNEVRVCATPALLQCRSNVVDTPFLVPTSSQANSVPKNSPYKASDVFLLRSKALETISILFTATDVSLVAADMTEIMTATSQFDLSTVDPSDPFKTFVIKMWARIAKVTGPAFEPYLPHILPEIVRSLELDVESAVPSYHVDDNDDKEEEGERLRQRHGFTSSVVARFACRAADPVLFLSS